MEDFEAEWCRLKENGEEDLKVRIIVMYEPAAAEKMAITV
jgi:hypothetical protein